MNISLEILNEYVEKGLLSRQKHPRFPLSIYNYTQKVQYDKIWDEITLMSRGLIVEDTGKIIAKPFEKFFNMEELTEIPNEPFEVFEKMDGSLGIVFHYEDDWHVATRGSFTSPQALKGREILREKRYDETLLVPALVYLFEIIYPENRIVVDYGKEEKMVMLAAFGAEMCHEFSYDTLFHDHLEYRDKSILVKRYDGIRDYRELKEMISNNAEGFVVKFKSGKRMKIKGEEYLRLHRILTGISSYDVWESLRQQNSISAKMLDRLPDEFYSWVNQTEKQLRENFSELENKIHSEYESLRKSLSNVPGEEFDKTFALAVQNSPLKSYFFSLKRGRDITDSIWKNIKPLYSKPFSEKG